MKEKTKESLSFEESGDELIIEDNFRDSFLNQRDQSSLKKLKNKCLNPPFILYFFILIFIFSFSLIIFYIIFYNSEKINFIKFDRNWIPLKLNNRKYENYLFDNGLEVMLIHDPYFDRDGGAIVIENGYLDNPSDEGLSNFATFLLCHMAFNNDPNNIDILEDYFGRFKYETEDYFTNFRFDILNDGFKRFLNIFSTVLNLEKIKNLTIFNIAKKELIDKIRANYEGKIMDIYYRENHLIEYFVYGFKNKSEGEILPEGNIEKLKDINFEEISNYLDNLINPPKIKIVLFSKYKFSLSSKYMKYYFKYLIDKEKLSKNKNEYYAKENLNEYGEKEFNTSQIFYIKANYYESNYIKIIYFINKVSNESFSELFYKQNYFNYISDFISKTKNGSLYSIINQNVKSIYSEIEIILKSKIKFSIVIELNGLKNINDVIYATYRYIDKITNETNQKIIQMDRYEELKDIYRHNTNISEKTLDTIELACENGRHLIRAKYAEPYFFYSYGVPWNDSINYNYKKIPNEVEPYFRQLKPNNSIIILAIRDKDKKKLTCNNNSKFDLNCSYFKDESNIKITTFYNVSYINYTFNSTNLEENLKKEINNDFNITFEKNEFKSKYKEPLDENEKDEKKMINLTDDNDISLNKFYFKLNSNFRIQRVLIKFNLYHPYLRPNNTEDNEKKCNYFLIMEMFSAIKRKINEKLADAISAENQIYFEQNENNLYILVFCFSDQAYKISKIISHIIYEMDWENETDFFSNNEIYKNEVFDDFFIYNQENVEDISRFYFKLPLKNNIYNKFEFFPEEFEKNGDYNTCINITNKTEFFKLLTSFIIQGYIYGFLDKETAKQISYLFNQTNINISEKLLNIVNIKETTPTNFVNWMKQINNININEINITIKEKIYDRIKNGDIYYSYRILKKESSETQNLNIYIFQNIIEDMKRKDKDNSSLISKEMLFYNNSIFELNFAKFNDKIKIPNEELVKNETELLLNRFWEFNKSVDNIGNRYYYLIKNIKSSIRTTQTLFDKGLEEINENEYKNTNLNTSKIIEEYDNKYKKRKINEHELNNIIKYWKEKLKNLSRINIFTKNEIDM